jgi:hypothetical protein
MASLLRDLPAALNVQPGARSRGQGGTKRNEFRFDFGFVPTFRRRSAPGHSRHSGVPLFHVAGGDVDELQHLLDFREIGVRLFRLRIRSLTISINGVPQRFRSTSWNNDSIFEAVVNTLSASSSICTRVMPIRLPPVIST